MTAVQIHLALTHAPVIIIPLATLALGLAWLLHRQEARQWALMAILAGALPVFVIFESGEGSEEQVEKLPGVSEQQIERHEGKAKAAMPLTLGAGLLALGALLLRKREKAARMAMGLTLLLGMAASGALALTAHSGGLIRHSELASSPQVGDGAGPSQGSEKDDDD